jgi:hypothetical protein
MTEAGRNGMSTLKGCEANESEAPQFETTAVPSNPLRVESEFSIMARRSQGVQAVNLEFQRRFTSI